MTKTTGDLAKIARQKRSDLFAIILRILQVNAPDEHDQEGTCQEDRRELNTAGPLVSWHRSTSEANLPVEVAKAKEKKRKVEPEQCNSSNSRRLSTKCRSKWVGLEMDSSWGKGATHVQV